MQTHSAIEAIIFARSMGQARPPARLFEQLLWGIGLGIAAVCFTKTSACFPHHFLRQTASAAKERKEKKLRILVLTYCKGKGGGRTSMGIRRSSGNRSVHGLKERGRGVSAGSRDRGKRAHFLAVCARSPRNQALPSDSGLFDARFAWV